MKDSFEDKSILDKIFSKIVEGVVGYLASLENKTIDYAYKKSINGAPEVVSDADKIIEVICVGVLKTYFPDIPVIAEESYDSDRAVDTGTFFVIDPIDGTANFLEGGRDWSVSISLICGNKSIVGFLYFPKKSINILAIEHKGTWLNERKMKPLNKNADLKIAVSPNQISSKQFKGILDENFLNFTIIPHFTPKILAILNGEVNAALYMPQTGKYASLWDYAAASLVLHELGGKLKSMSGKDMNFSGNRVIHTDGWIATDSSKNNAFLSSLFRNICLE